MWSLALAVAPAASEPDRSSTVWALVALLVVLGVALVMLAVWLVRATRVDPEVLAPLERMGERTWRSADPVYQRRELDEIRPEGAEPLAPMAAPPRVDEAFEKGPQAPGFDDLQDVAPIIDADVAAGDPTSDAPDPVAGSDDLTVDAIDPSEPPDSMTSMSGVDDAEDVAPNVETDVAAGWSTTHEPDAEPTSDDGSERVADRAETTIVVDGHDTDGEVHGDTGTASAGERLADSEPTDGSDDGSADRSAEESPSPSSSEPDDRGGRRGRRRILRRRR